MQLKGSTFIVTGGASGLGEGTVKMLIEGGANVVIAGSGFASSGNRVFVRSR